MKIVEFFQKLCYSTRIKMKLQFKNGLLCILSAVCASALVVCVTVIAVHHTNTAGQGGLETPGLPELTEDVLDETAPLIAGQSEIQDDSKDRVLSYMSYRVKQGDMISVIADSFNVTQDTIISVNNIRASRLIQIGQYLKIPSMPGILYTVKDDGETPETIAKKYNVDATKCALANNKEQTTSLSSGSTIFVPDAELDWVTRQEINGDLFRKPLHSYFYISSYYGWRTSPFDASRRTFHGGIDMATSYGTSIYAALTGVVSTVGYNDTYGNYVIVSHHSGYKTLYGHMSAVLVVKGQAVSTDTRLGRVGSTGMSTGPHLHFTVYKNGRSINPANLWK
jgi:murein DD-endopeptidase MepM/ murein hydrolase activator NlpD